MPERPLSVVVVGYGFGGRVFHAPLVAAAPDLSLDAIVTSDPVRAELARSTYPNIRIIATADEAFAKGFDLAAISTANVMHVPQALAALDQGMNVVLDKPVAATARQARALADRAAERGRLLVPFQNRRWDSDIRTAIRIEREGRLGTVHRFESRITKMRVVPRDGWRGLSEPDQMGGMLYDLGVHAIDQAMQLMGPVATVACWARSVRPADSTDDDTLIVLTHVSGSVSVLSVSQVHAFSEPRMLVLGTQGGLRIDPADDQEADMLAGVDPTSPQWGARRAGTEGRLRVFDESSQCTEERLVLERGAWTQFYPAVARAIRGDGPVPVDIADAVQTARVMDAAREAWQQQTIVTLDPPAAHA